MEKSAIAVGFINYQPAFWVRRGTPVIVGGPVALNTHKDQSYL